MKPEADQILYRSAEQLQLEIAPQLRTGYAQGTVSLVAVLNIMAAQEYERGAEIRKLENDDMRALFRQLAPFAADAELRTRLEAAAATRDASLAISALDAAKFFADPLVAGSRCYRTGDVGRLDDAGNLHFLGRAGSRVKVRGYTIELAEVEAALVAWPHAAAVAAAAEPDAADPASMRLVAYVEPRAGAPREPRLEVTTAA